MASITKNGPSWRVRIKHKGTVVATKSFRLKAEALAWAQEQERQLETASRIGEQKTVAQALQRYAEEESPKKRGRRWEEVRLAKLIRDLPFSARPLTEVTPADIAAWRDSQSNAPGTVRREMVLLNSVFTICVREWGWLRVNPMSAVRKPPNARARDRVFTDEEVEAICEKLVGPKGRLVALVFRIAIETAMRSGEIVSLTRDQVDLKKRVVRLSKTKNGDKRDVPLSLEAINLFEVALKSGSGDRVFDLTDAVRDVLFRQARNAAGVEGATFHDSRATALTRLARKVDVLTLARIAGHRDLKSLQVYYRESAEDIALRL